MSKGGDTIIFGGHGGGDDHEEHKMSMLNEWMNYSVCQYIMLILFICKSKFQYQ